MTARFLSVHTALRWAYAVMAQHPSARSILDPSVRGRGAELARDERLAQAAQIVGHLEAVFDPRRWHGAGARAKRRGKQLLVDYNLCICFARYYYGRATTPEESAVLRRHVAGGLPEWARARAGSREIDLLLLRFAGYKQVGWRRIKTALRCRTEQARQAVNAIADRLQPIKDDIDAKLHERLVDAGIVMARTE